MKLRIQGLASLTIMLLATSMGSALTIKFASLAPGGSPWDKGLRQISSQWSALSGGTIDLKIYGGGVAGDDEDMIRKMRIGQLNAAGLTGVGLSRVFNGVLAIQLPSLIQSDDELNYVLDKMKPEFEKQLDASGFRVLVWTKVGWVHFFSKRPIVGPDDMRQHKMFVWAGDPAGVQVWKDAGFNPIPLQATDLMTSLQSGMVDAFSTTPLSAASYQWFGLAKNMCAMKWAPLIGGIVVTEATWKKITPDLQVKLAQAAVDIGRSMQKDIDKADAQAIDIMKQNGLVVNPVPAAVVAQWKAIADSAFGKLAGKSFDDASYQEILKYLQEFRSTK